jgi:hypothetical protein
MSKIKLQDRGPNANVDIWFPKEFMWCRTLLRPWNWEDDRGAGEISCPWLMTLIDLFPCQSASILWRFFCVLPMYLYRITSRNVISGSYTLQIPPFPVIIHQLSWNSYYRFYLPVEALNRLCGLVVRVPGYTTEMYCASSEVRTQFIYVM